MRSKAFMKQKKGSGNMRLLLIEEQWKERCFLQSFLVRLCVKQGQKSSVCSCPFIIICIKKYRNQRKAEQGGVSSVRDCGFIICFSAVKEKIPVKGFSVSVLRVHCIGSVSVEHWKGSKKETASFFTVFRFGIRSVIERKYRMVFISFVFSPEYEREKGLVSGTQIFRITEVQYPVFFSGIYSARESVIKREKCT